MDKRERAWILEPGLWLIFFVYLLLSVISFNRGLFLEDEGFHLYFSWEIAHNQDIYRNFSVRIAPLSFLIQAVLIKVFGVQLIYSRIYALLLGVAGFFGIAYICRRVSGERFWLMGLSLYIFFSNTLFNYSHYSIDSKVFLFLSLASGLWWYGSGSLTGMFLSGLFSGMASFSYQSFILVSVMEFFGLMFLRRERDFKLIVSGVCFLIGFSLVGIIVGMYLYERRLIEEAFRSLFFSLGTKRHIYQYLMRVVFPFMLICAFATAGLKRLWNSGGIMQALVVGVIVLALIICGYYLYERMFLFPHALALFIITVLFALSGAHLRERESERELWFVFGFCLLFFLVRLLSGYDLLHSVVSMVGIIPWVGFLSERFQERGLKICGISPAVAMVLGFFYLIGLYLYLTRYEYFGEAEALYRCDSQMDLRTARGIYVSKEQRDELEFLVNEVQKRSGDKERILVYPNHLLLYYLADRGSVARNAYLYYELASISDLKYAVEKARERMSLVIFQLKGGKIFQPIASERANELIEELSGACSEKVFLKNYMLCAL